MADNVEQMLQVVRGAGLWDEIRTSPKMRRAIIDGHDLVLVVSRARGPGDWAIADGELLVSTQDFANLRAYDVHFTELESQGAG